MRASGAAREGPLLTLLSATARRGLGPPPPEGGTDAVQRRRKRLGRRCV